jgi:8-oxo-dGTP pyrophosphatase MutT (NUDIX family)
MSETSDPVQAATVIVLRAAEPEGFEVLLTRRPPGMAFLGGMYCFPGGTVRNEDCSEAIFSRARGPTPQQARTIVGAHFSPRRALGIWIAAVRELFEEVGILLAVDENGRAMAAGRERKARLAQKQSALADRSVSFLSVLESEDLFCDTARLIYFSHWQTPARDPIRFNTRFFLAKSPEDQTPLPSSYEVAEARWVTPEHALKLFARGELPMIIPTFASLRTLADFDNIESVFREFCTPSRPANLTRTN